MTKARRVRNNNPVSTQTRTLRALERMAAVQKAREDLLTFTMLMMPDPSDPDNVNVSLYQPAKHHRVLAAALEEVVAGKIKRLIVNMPPRHGKTELASKKLIAWFAGNYPHLSVIFGTYNEKYAAEVGQAVKEIAQSPYFQQVFPDCVLREDSQANDRLKTQDGGVLAFVGRGGTTTGRGADLLIIDDPIKDDKEARSPTTRDSAWKWFTRVAGTRLMTDDAPIVIIQTRWHEDDIVGRLTDPSNDEYDPEEAKQWKIIDLPALAMDNDPLGRQRGEPLWPERFSAKFLLERQRQDPVGFSALYQGRPTPESGVFFQTDWLNTYKPHELPKNLRYYIASDHAVSLVQNRDKTCIIPVGVDENENIYVMQDVWWRQASTDQTVEAMLALIKRYRPHFWWAERTHITKSIGPFLRKRMVEENCICAVCEITPIVDKQTRAQSIQGRMAMGKVFFPERAVWWPEARDQMTKFPGAQHDDFVDALAYIGLGMATIVSAAPTRQRAVVKDGTFGALMEQSRRQKRELALARSVGGW